jgi:hypothetical protein
VICNKGKYSDEHFVSSYSTFFFAVSAIHQSWAVCLCPRYKIPPHDVASYIPSGGSSIFVTRHCLQMNDSSLLDKIDNYSSNSSSTPKWIHVLLPILDCGQAAPLCNRSSPFIVQGGILAMAASHTAHDLSPPPTPSTFCMGVASSNTLCSGVTLLTRGAGADGMASAETTTKRGEVLSWPSTPPISFSPLILMLSALRGRAGRICAPWSQGVLCVPMLADAKALSRALAGMVEVADVGERQGVISCSVSLSLACSVNLICL